MPDITPQALAAAIECYDDVPGIDYVVVLWHDGGFSVEPLGDPVVVNGWWVRRHIQGGKGLMGPAAACNPHVINNLYADFRASINDWRLTTERPMYDNWLWDKFLQRSVVHPVDPPISP